MNTPSNSRRNFLKTVAGISVLTPFSTSFAEPLHDSHKTIKNAKNLIFLVVDGMGRGTLSLANNFSNRHFNAPLNWVQLMNHKHVYSSLQDTASFNSYVTDSAAAASAWGCGVRVPNGRINVDAEGRSIEPIFSRAKSKGKAVGLVTTTSITHATPAGFAANAESRYDQETIAQQYLEREIDLLLGGGAKYFKDDNEALLKRFKDKGYSVVQVLDDLIFNKNRSKLLGLFADSHLPYAIDRKNAQQYFSVPSLNEMFVVALENLQTSKNGFVLQVESGRVDHAGHVNDTGAIIEEQLEFDRCITTAIDFANQSPETLVIITTDHGCGGCQLNGIGHRYLDSNKGMDQILKQKASLEYIEKQFLKLGHPDKELFQSLMGVSLRDKDLKTIQSMLNNEYIREKYGFVARDSHGDTSDSDDGKTAKSKSYFLADLAEYFQEAQFESTGVSWTSHQHTSELVDLMAYGPHANALPSFMKNYELNTFMCDALNI